MAYTYSETVNVACLVTLSSMKLAVFNFKHVFLLLFFVCLFVFFMHVNKFYQIA